VPVSGGQLRSALSRLGHAGDGSLWTKLSWIHYLVPVREGRLYVLSGQNPADENIRPAHHRTSEKGHGRLEQRVLETSPALAAYLDWPGIDQVMRRHYRRLVLKTGEVSFETTYGITSLHFPEVGAAALEQLWRGHWTVKNRVHRVRDGTMGENAGETHAGNAAHALAALCTALLNLFRQHGWSNTANAFCYYDASVQHTLDLIGAAPT
jgi:hypothetical protein